MIGVAPEAWSKLTVPGGESLTARYAISAVTERLLAAVDADGLRHLLVPLLSNDEDFRDTQSRGITVSTRELTVLNHGTGRYLDFQCLDTAGYEAFDLIGGELAEGLKSEGAKPAVLATRVLSKWRRFWGQLPKTLLSREEQLGLFAELWFLSEWLLPSGGLKVIDRWRGPLGARHDFEWIGRSVEVKATTSVRGRTHCIHGLDQLALPDKGDLLFFSQQLREEAGATNTLPGLVSRCRTQLTPDDDVLGRFESLLVQAGYSPIHEEEYAKLRLRVIDEALFKVEKDFPRLMSSQFKKGIPAGVERVDYEINLATFNHLRVAKVPAEAKGLLK